MFSRTVGISRIGEVPVGGLAGGQYPGYAHPLRRASKWLKSLQTPPWVAAASLERQASDLSRRLLSTLYVASWEPFPACVHSAEALHSELQRAVGTLAGERKALVQLDPVYRLGDAAARLLYPPLEPFRMDLQELLAACILASVPLGQLGERGVHAMTILAPANLRCKDTPWQRYRGRDGASVQSLAEALVYGGLHPKEAVSTSRSLNESNPDAAEIAQVLLLDGIPASDALPSALALAR